LIAILLFYSRVKIPRLKARIRRRRRALKQRITYGFGSRRSRPGEMRDAKLVYTLRVYPGRITVFQTTEAVRDAWAGLAGGGMDYYVVPGTHHSIFREPQVRSLAEKLAVCLDQAENGSMDSVS
jgi:hypothetical protein